MYAFGQPDGTVIIWDSKKNVDLCISKLQHGLSSIGNITLEDEKTLFLFDYKLNLVVKFCLYLVPDLDRTCNVKKVFKISDFPDEPPDFITVSRNMLIANYYSDGVHSAKLHEGN